jgi:hypothetical protein
VRRVRRRRSRSKQAKRRKRGLFIGLGIVVFAGLCAGWLLYTGLAAKSQLETVRDDVHELRDEINNGDLAAARVTADQISSHARRAHEYTTGPLWATGATLPYVGDPLDSARTLTTSIDSIAGGALPALVKASHSLDPKTLRAANGAVNLAPIAAAAPALDRAAADMNHALARIDNLSGSTWLGAINSARSDAIKQLTPLTKTVNSADIAADTAPAMLGESGPKYYMVSFENEAELRGTGGLPGAFAIAKADHGQLTFTRFEPDTTLVNVKSGLDFGANFDATYNAATVTGDYRESNLSPNFPYAARIWLAEWQKVSGQRLDGAVILDPTALSYFLNVTGPTSLPDGTKVTSDNVVQLSEQTVYKTFSTAQNLQRKEFLLDIAKSVSDRLIASRGSTEGLVKAAGMAASQRRLLVWSADPTVEARLATVSIGGVIEPTTSPYAVVAINNAGGNKWQALTCGKTRRVRVRITLHNEAPLGLPKYVLGFTGRPGLPQKPGDNRLLVAFYGTQGGLLTSIELNGKPSTTASGSEYGHPVFTVLLPIPRGSTQTIQFNLLEPGSGLPSLRTQPMVNPMSSSVSAAPCS